MKTNSLPLEHSTIRRLIGFFKNTTELKSIEFETIYSKNELSEVKITDVEQCDINKINLLFKKLETYSDYVSVFLHGSWADNSTTSFSDIDDFIILDTESLIKSNKLLSVLRILNRIDMAFCRIDPIQHHGHWICSINELSNYDNSFMPLHILKKSKCIIGNNFITGSINNKITLTGIIYNIQRTCEEIEKLNALYIVDSINAYQLKRLAGSFVLMPAFIYQLKGYNYDKPESIRSANAIFSEQAHSCIEWSTNCRNNWDLITNNSKYRTFGLLSYLIFDPHLWRRFSQKFSMRISKENKHALSPIPLSEDAVQKFIFESLAYVN